MEITLILVFSCHGSYGHIGLTEKLYCYSTRRGSGVFDTARRQCSSQPSQPQTTSDRRRCQKPCPNCFSSRQSQFTPRQAEARRPEAQSSSLEEKRLAELEAPSSEVALQANLGLRLRLRLDSVRRPLPATSVPSVSLSCFERDSEVCEALFQMCFCSPI